MIRGRYAFIAVVIAGCSGSAKHATAAPASIVPVSQGPVLHRETASSSESGTPFKTVELQRIERGGGSRLRLVILTKGIHSADGYTLPVFSNDTGRETEAVERPDCGCNGRWVVTSYRPRGQRFLRSLRRGLRTKGEVGLGAQLRTVGGGPAAGFTLRSTGRPYRPALVTHGA